MSPVPIQDKCPGHREQVSGWKWWDLRKRADLCAISFSPADVQKIRMFKMLRQGHLVKGRDKGESGKHNRPSRHVMRIWDPSQDWRKADRWAVSRLWKKEGFQREGISEWNKTKERLRGMRRITNTLVLNWAAKVRTSAIPLAKDVRGQWKGLHSGQSDNTGSNSIKHYLRLEKGYNNKDRPHLFPSTTYRAGFSQLWHYWHLRLDHSLLYGAVLCTLEYLAASLTSTHLMPVASNHSTCENKKCF